VKGFDSGCRIAVELRKGKNGRSGIYFGERRSVWRVSQWIIAPLLLRLLTVECVNPICTEGGYKTQHTLHSALTKRTLVVSSLSPFYTRPFSRPTTTIMPVSKKSISSTIHILFNTPVVPVDTTQDEVGYQLEEMSTMDERKVASSRSSFDSVALSEFEIPSFLPTAINTKRWSQRSSSS